MVREEHVSLSRLIDIINQRFGGELNEADQLFFDQIAEAATRSDRVCIQGHLPRATTPSMMDAERRRRSPRS
jgi:hypothetical protein